MIAGRFRFDRFMLDLVERRLSRDGSPVDLNARYLDALALLVRSPGALVSKQRFHDEVWRGIPVTDEALTQCIRTLRRQLGDEAAAPRFIETVPKHGYRFIASVVTVEDGGAAQDQSHVDAAPPPLFPNPWRRFFLVGGAGTIGAGTAGTIGGLFYGFIGASQPFGPDMGAASVLLVLLWVTLAAALIGGAGVSFGIAAAGFAPRSPPLATLGGAFGGLIVGGIVKLLGVDAFNLLLGSSPGDITGAIEGFFLGGAVGLASWLATTERFRTFRRGIAVAAMVGAAAGALITAYVGRLMGGSLALLAATFPTSRLRMGPIAGLLGENHFGPMSQVVTGAFEGLLFATCIVGAMMLARHTLAFDGATQIPAHQI